MNGMPNTVKVIADASDRCIEDQDIISSFKGLQIIQHVFKCLKAVFFQRRFNH